MSMYNIDIGVTATNKSFTSYLKEAKSELKELDSGIKLSNASLKTFGNNIEEQNSLQQKLQEKIRAITDINAKYNQRISEQKEKLQGLKNTKQELLNKFNEEKEKLEQIASLYGKESSEYQKQEQIVKDLASAYEQEEEKINRVSTSINNMRTHINKNNENLINTKNQLESVNNSINNTSASTEELNKHVRNIDMNTVRDAAQDTFQTLDAGFTAVNSKIIDFGKSAIDEGKNFETSMANVSAITNASNSDFKKLRDTALQLGKDTKFTAGEVADAEGYLALAGQNTEQIIGGVNNYLKMAVISNTDLAETTDLTTDSMSALGLGLEKTTDYMDILCVAQSKSNMNTVQLQQAYLNCGGELRALGISTKDSAYYLGVLADQGLKGEEAGNNFQSLLVNLIGTSGKAKTALKDLGVSAWDSHGQFKGLDVTLAELKDKLDECTPAQKAIFEAQIGGKTQLTTLNMLLDSQSGKYKDLKDALQNTAGASDEAYNKMSNTTENKIAAMNSAISGLKLELFNDLKPVLENVIKYITNLCEWFDNLSPAAKKTIEVISAVSLALGALTKVAGGLINLWAGITVIKGGMAALAGGATAVGTASTGAAAGAAALGTATAGLGASLLPIVGIAAAVAAAIAGIIYVHKKLSESSVQSSKNIKVFGESVIDSNGKVMDSTEKLKEKAGNTVVAFSKQYKDAGQNILDTESKLTKDTKEYSASVGTAIAEKNRKIDELEKSLNTNLDMTQRQRTLASLNNLKSEKSQLLKESSDYNKKLLDDYNAYSKSVLDALSVSQKAKQKIAIETATNLYGENGERNKAKYKEFLKDFDDGQKKIKDSTTKTLKDIKTKYEKALKDGKGMSSETMASIINDENKLSKNILSKTAQTDDQVKVINDKLSKYRKSKSIEDAASIIASAEKERKGVIDKKTKQYKEERKLLEDEIRDSEGKKKADLQTQLNDLDKNYNAQVSKAEDKKKRVINQLVAENKDILDKVDTNNGHILSKREQLTRRMGISQAQQTKDVKGSIEEQIVEYDKLPKEKQTKYTVIGIFGGLLSAIAGDFGFVRKIFGSIFSNSVPGSVSTSVSINAKAKNQAQLNAVNYVKLNNKLDTVNYNLLRILNGINTGNGNLKNIRGGLISVQNTSPNLDINTIDRKLYNNKQQHNNIIGKGRRI